MKSRQAPSKPRSTRPPIRASRLLAAAAAIAFALPARAKDATAPTGTLAPAPTAPPAPVATPAPAQVAPSRPADSVGESETGVVELDAQQLNESTPPPVEYPAHARRDPRIVGRLDPVDLGIGAAPFKGASGAFLAGLMRRMETPIASRWAHIALRNLLLAKVQAPRNVNPVDWAAERSWLLLRMGEADSARMLVSGVDVGRFTPRVFHRGGESGLGHF